MTTPTTALATTNGSAVAVRTPGPSTINAIEAILRPAGCRDLIPDGPLAGYSRAMVNVAKNSVAKGAPDEELYRFFVQCIRYNLDPMAREVWCINMAAKDQTAQWVVQPSRDGYRRAARRNPTVADVRSGLVHDGDDFSYDGEAGTYVHKVRVTAKKGVIIGAYCQIVMADGRKHFEFFYLDEVKRSTPVWQNFPDRMVIAAAERTMIKRHVGMSDLYTDDSAYERLTEMETALLVNTSEAKAEEYFDGFAVGVVIPETTTTAQKPPSPHRILWQAACDALAEDGRTESLTALIDWRFDGRTSDVLTDAERLEMAEWLKEPENVTVALAEIQAAADAVWQRDALAKEKAEAGEVVHDDDIPPFDPTDAVAS